jgi:type II secretory pathway pseudopilin PulG
MVLFLHFLEQKEKQMKATKVTAVVGLVSILGLIVYMRRRQKTNRRKMQIAEQGYETAQDVLFPMKSRRKQIIQVDTKIAS